MNTFKQLSLLISAAVGIIFAACEMKIPPFIGPTDRPVGDTTIIVSNTDSLIIPEEAAGWNIPTEAIDVLQARKICETLESGATSGTKYYVMGYVKKIHNKHADGVTTYGNAQFYMENVKEANSNDDFMAFQVYGPNGAKITDPNAVAVGDFVVVYGELTNYNGTFETVGKGAAYIWKSTNSLFKPQPKEVMIYEKDLTASNALSDLGVANITGDSKWAYNRRGIKCVQINGANNEDWLITPALDLTGATEATLNFRYKFSSTIPTDLQKQYSVWVSKDYNGNTDSITNATWSELKGISYEATDFVDSEVIKLPQDMLGDTCYIAWKYATKEISHTWAMQNITVKAKKLE